MDSNLKRSSLIRRTAVAAVGGLGATLFIAAPASAEPLITVNVDNVAYGEEGDLLLVGSATVPSDFVGETCLIEGESLNQESVHPNNNLIIVAGDQRLVVLDVEGLAGQVSKAAEFEEIAPTIQVFIELGPDGVTSGGFTVTVDCTVEPPVPTTIAPPTTTPPTTTPPTTTPPTTGDLEPEGGGEIIDSSTTTVPAPAGPVVTSPTPPTTDSAPPPAGPTLPVTGSTIGIFAFSGLWLVAAGFFLHQRAAMFRPNR